MNKQLLQEIMELSQECLARFWQMDPEFVMPVSVIVAQITLLILGAALMVSCSRRKVIN